MCAARRHGLGDAHRRARGLLAELSLRDRDLRVRDDALSFGLLAYLLAFLVLPALHLGNHTLDHDHGHDGTAAHHHDGDRPDAPRPTPVHGHGTTSHFAAAFSAATTFVFLPAVQPFVAAPCVAPAPAPDLGVPDGCAQPRGPPGVA